MSRAQSNQLFNTTSGNANNISGTLTPNLTNQLNNPGYTDAQKAAITGATEGGIGAAFGSSAEGAANRAARTNNAAGLTSTGDALARQRMVTSGQLGAENQTNFANDAQRQEQAAQSGLAGLFGTNLGVASKEAGTPSFWDQFGNQVANKTGAAVGDFAAGFLPG